MTAAPHPATEHPEAAPRRVRWRVAAICAAAAVGVLATLSVFRLAQDRERRAADAAFVGKAKDFLQLTDSELQKAAALMDTLRAYFEAADRPVSRAEFDRFSAEIHSRVVGLRDLGWAPTVTGAQRPAFEREARAAGAADFQILERSAAGRLVRAGDRPQYQPILYLDSGAARQPVLGFDLASETTRRKAIERALQTRRPAATPPIDLITVERAHGGVMGFVAVDPRTGAGPARRGPPPGVAFAAIEVEAMLQNILADRARLAGVDVAVFDSNGGPARRLVYSRSASGKAAVAEVSLLDGPHLSGVVTLLDQPWTIVFTPAPSLDDAAWNWPAVLALVSGLAMTVMATAFMAFSLRQTLRLERLSSELRGTTEDLDRQVRHVGFLARHDTMTRLPNRILFEERMKLALAGLESGIPFALLCVDLDRFKQVNGALGHRAGDDLLQQVGQRLATCLREGDTVARLGGDEFAVILADTASRELVGEIAARLVEMAGRDCALGATTVSVGLSVGIAMAPADGDTFDLLLGRADAALQAAKAGGRGRCCFFEPALAAGTSGARSAPSVDA